MTYIEYILSSQLLQLSGSELNKICAYVLYQLYNKNFVEIRIHVSSLLLELIHYTDVNINLLNISNKNLSNC